MGTSEIIRLNDSTWLLSGPTNIGFVERDGEVYLIDSGNDKESGRRIRKVLDERGWKLKALVNTHSNADHIGGNDYLQRLTGCQIWAPAVEVPFIEYPKFESAFLWGGFPIKELGSKFFEAKPSSVTHKMGPEAEMIDDTLQVVHLPGHFFGMIGLLTEDGVFFLGDSMFGENILKKYKLPFIYDVRSYKETIEAVRSIEAEHYIVSHGEPLREIGELAEINLALVEDVEARLEEILEKEKTTEETLTELCDHYGIVLDHGQYALVGSTLRSFLSYLYHESRIVWEFRENRLYWKHV
jgi:glyoxylase-like metal-dependent hydrolase (beta-lactamase superfamily II)